MNQQHQERQNKSLPPSLFKTATYLSQTSKASKEKSFHKTLHQSFNPNVLHWNQSSTSLTRDKAPSHRIPKAQRFHTISAQIIHHTENTFLQLLKSQTTKNKDQLQNKTRGVSFAKSERPEHFVRVNSLNPSPSAYNQQRFMDETNYKTQSSLLKTQTTFQSQVAKRTTVRGIQFCRFKNYHKSFLDHAKHRPYQPQDTIRNPGPGNYKNPFATKKRQIRFSFQKAINRFSGPNEMKPGPGAYGAQDKKSNSFNVKGTISQSKREYLTKFQSNPAPDCYDIPRFLQSKNKI